MSVKTACSKSVDLNLQLDLGHAASMFIDSLVLHANNKCQNREILASCQFCGKFLCNKPFPDHDCDFTNLKNHHTSSNIIYKKPIFHQPSLYN